MDHAKKEQDPKKKYWMDIRFPSYEIVQFTPLIAPDFSGIKIWAPEHISLKATQCMPLFGVVQLKEEALKEINISDKHPLRAVVVGAIVAGINEPYMGNVVAQAPLFPSSSTLNSVIEHFNIDVFETTGMLRAPGKYFLFASIGPHVAESVSVEVVAS